MRCVGFLRHGNGVGIGPVDIRPILPHHPKGEVDVRARYQFACHSEFEPAIERRRNHEQGGNILRTDIAGDFQPSAGKATATYQERRITLLAQISDVGPEIAQGIDKRTNRPVAHTVGPREHMFAFGSGKVSGKETHGSTSSPHVNGRATVFKCLHHDLRVIAVGKVIRMHVASGQGTDDERTVADALRRGQGHVGMDGGGCRDLVLHI